ncbi:MAG: hypothetical protein OXI77_13090 [Chloroflexota bacterium]|nr:hypothetical protein [Chloroflexota bacterium]MDE2909259.1 hypothetical protein [Chloroflexota bacterium]
MKRLVVVMLVAFTLMEVVPVLGQQSSESAKSDDTVVAMSDNSAHCRLNVPEAYARAKYFWNANRKIYRAYIDTAWLPNNYFANVFIVQSGALVRVEITHMYQPGRYRKVGEKHCGIPA